MKNPEESIINTLIDMLDCSSEEAKMLAEEILDNLKKDDFFITKVLRNDR